MPVFTHRGATVSYGSTGTGETVVLLHSGGSSGAQWRRVGERLPGYRRLTPDFYGYGGTDAWTGDRPLSHDDQADLAAAVLAHAGGGPVHVVGHSYGGAGAVRMVVRRLAEIRSLVLIEPMLAPLLAQAGEAALFADYEALAYGFLEHAEAGRDDEAWRHFIDYRQGLGSWEGWPAATRRRFLPLTRATAQSFRSNLANPTTLEDCRRLELPVTVVCGAKTTAPDRRVTELLRDTIPTAAYVVIPDAEHMSPLTHPEAVAAILRGHLRAAAGPG